MKVFSQYIYVFPDFKKYLNHDTPKSCIESIYQDKGIKFVFKFYRKYSYIGSLMGGLIASLFDAAMKTLHAQQDELKKKDRHRYKEFRKEYKENKKFQKNMHRAEETRKMAEEARKKEEEEFQKQQRSQANASSKNASAHSRQDEASRANQQPLLQVPNELRTLATYRDNKDFQGLLSLYAKLDKKLLKARDPVEVTKEEAGNYLKTTFSVTTLQEIKSHYKKISLIMHPDKTGHLQSSSRAFLEELYKFVSHYYAIATA